MSQRIWEQDFGAITLPVSFEEFFKELVDVDNVLLREGDGHYSLGHLSFQEFLVANALVNRQKISSLAQRFGDPWWHEVMVFFVGITGDASSFVEKIAEVSPLRDTSPFVKRLLNEATYTPPRMKRLISDISNY